MKTYLLLIAVMSFSISNAQPGNYAGPAKSYISSFWEKSKMVRGMIEKGNLLSVSSRIGNMEKNITDIKSKDPAYNTAPMFEEVTKVKEFHEAKDKELSAQFKKQEDDKKAAIQANRDKTFNMQKVDQALRSLFHISTDVDNGGLRTIKEVIEAYKKRTTEMLTMDKSTNKGDLEKYIVSLKNDFKSAESDLYELDRRCREQTVAENAEVQYYELLYKQAYWDAAQKLYPDVPEFAKAYETATKLITGLGSISDVHSLAAKSKQQKINETKLPAAVLKDAALEKMFIDVFNKQYGEEFKGTATKAVLLSDDWSILRHEITGIVTGRRRHAAIVYKGTNGKCYLTSNFFIHQEYVGSSFINTKSIYVVMGSQEMLCTNVK